MTEPKYAGDGLAVVNVAGHHHTDGSAEREELNFNDFILFGLRRAWSQTRRHINRHGFGNEARTRIELQDPFPMGGSIAGFLHQFALGRSQLVFALIYSSRAKLPEKLLSGVAILAYQQHASLGAGFIDREDDHRTGVPDNVATATDAGRFQHLIGRDPERGAAIGFYGRKHTSFGFGAR